MKVSLLMNPFMKFVKNSTSKFHQLYHIVHGTMSCAFGDM